MGNTTKGDVIELGGYEFKRVKNGLDEAQVTSYITELISERNKLLQCQDHLSSLTTLAERTVAEADRLAEQIKTETVDQAKNEAATIITQAEEQAQEMVEERRAEIITTADEQAVAIKAEAERKAELLLENEKRKIRPELSDFVNKLFSQLLSEFESFKQQIVSSQEEFGHKLSHLEEETSTVTMEEDERRDEFPEPIKTADQTNIGEPGWELEVLPPLDVVKMMEVVTYLDQLPEIERTEIIPRADIPSIMVFVSKPINLIDVLKTLPEVVQVKEDAAADTDTNGQLRKVQIVLSEEIVPGEAS